MGTGWIRGVGAAALVAAVLAAAPVRAGTLLVPPDGAVVSVPEVLLVYTVPAGEKTLVRENGRPIAARTAVVPGNEEDLHHVWLPLEEGRHTFHVLRAADESELFRFSVTYVPPYSMRTPAGPGDRRYAFHTREREKACAACHNLPETYETLPDQPLAPAGKVCAACHPRVDAGPNLHGPTAVYACFMCHAPEYEPARFAVRGSETDGCGTCHDEFLARLRGEKRYVHGPVAAGGCLVCHDPHGGKTSAVLRETPPELCLVCHGDTLPLPVETGLHGSVPCTRCHDPHGGPCQVLTPAEGNAFCARCHPGAVENTAGHPIPGHPVSGEVDPSSPGRPFGCASCHDPHGQRDVSRLRITENEAAQRRFCRRCHY